MARLTEEQKADAPRNMANLWGFAVDKIHIEPGFNVREEGPDLTAHIRWLADQMKAVGFDQTQPLAVIRHPEMLGHVIVRKGHCRFQGVLLARSEGASIEVVPCLIEPKGSNPILQTYQLGTSNTGKSLSYLGYATAIMRLRAWGETDAQIIAGFGGADAGKSQGWLNAVLTLNEASPELLRIVKAGDLADTTALKIMRRHKGNAPVVARAVVEHAHARGKKRGTDRDVDAVTATRTEPESVCSLAIAAVEAWRSGDGLDAAMARLEARLGPLLAKVA